jgi:hypothetical protein
MRIVTLGAIAAGLLGLAACHANTPQENAAANFEEATDNQADLIEDMASNTSNDMIADNLVNAADSMRDAGENAADAIENVPGPVNGM